MRELFAKEVLGFTFVEVYFSYGMHGEAVVACFLGQVVTNNLLDYGVEAKARRKLGLIFACCCCCYCNLFLL